MTRRHFHSIDQFDWVINIMYQLDTCTDRDCGSARDYGDFCETREFSPRDVTDKY